MRAFAALLAALTGACASSDPPGLWLRLNDPELLTSNGQRLFEIADVVRAIERGEAIVEMAEGDRQAGMAALEQAAAAELALPIVFGPPVIFKPSYEILGELHLAEGRNAQAAAAFEKSLKLAPGRRLSLAGLKAAAAR